jgi:pimeloyl-ACP methyl ester carboxylesterase
MRRKSLQSSATSLHDKHTRKEQLAKDFAQLSQTKLMMPVLSIGCEKSLGKELDEQTKLIEANATVIVLPNTGHWILHERSKGTIDP